MLRDAGRHFRSGGRKLAPFAALAAATVLLFWKLTLTNQFTWLDSPDLVNQVLPWLQEQTRQLRSGMLPLWDHHQWTGYPLVGQGQTGVLFPLNWLLALTPQPDGHLKLAWVNWYFVLIHFVIAATAYWLCRDRGANRAGALIGGVVFGLGGFVAGNFWPQMINGAIFAPLVLGFVLRTVDGRFPLPSAAMAGAALGCSLWSGHHQIPTYLGLMAVFNLIAAGVLQRTPVRDTVRQVAVLGAIAAIIGSPQLWSSRQYYAEALRWVGTQHPVAWNDQVPYVAHMQWSLYPGQIVGLVLPLFFSNLTVYVGATCVALAALGIMARKAEVATKLMIGTGIVAFFFAIGQHSPVHGILYALVPTLDKARVPSFAIILLHLVIACFAAMGATALAQGRIARIAAMVLFGFSGVIFVTLAIRSLFSGDWLVEAGPTASSMAAATAACTAAVLWKPQARAAWLLLAIVLCENGFQTGATLRHREQNWTFLGPMLDSRELGDFVRRNVGFQRIDRNSQDIAWNFGDWHNVDERGGYVSPLAAVIRAPGENLTALLGIKYWVGKTPRVPDQKVVFEGSTGLKVFEESSYFPRAWSVHSVRAVPTEKELHQMLAGPGETLRQAAPVSADFNQAAVSSCQSPDTVGVSAMTPSSVKIKAVMSCAGLVVLSNAHFPEWQASVDGKPSSIHKVYGFMQGITLDAGTHTVELVYRPYSLYGLFVLSWVALAGTIVFYRRTTSGSTRPPSRESGDTRQASSVA